MIGRNNWDEFIEIQKSVQKAEELPVAIFGRTGKGKSTYCILPYSMETIKKHESLIILDPKGEVYNNIACYIPESYQVFCIDFRNPRKSPTRWNPLDTIFRLFQSKDPDDNDIASSMLSEFWSGVYPYDGTSDRFWPDSAAQYAKGLTYALFETFKEKEYANLNNVAIMMEQSEIKLGGNTVLKTYYDSLPSDSLAKRNLAPYATAPNETRGSIHSVAASGLELFSRSKGLMEMLSEDTLNILDIDVERPFACFIITPDETDVYSSLSGLLITQITQHLIRIAQEKGGKLPLKVSIILEELGSVGKSIPSLPNLMVAGRSRNLRPVLVLQSFSQLTDIYGKSKAETIKSCIGILIGFSTHDWDTLSEWSLRCGDRVIENGDHMIKEPLITPTQLAAMPTGTALILVDSRYKIIYPLPFYYDIYDTSDWKPPHYCPMSLKHGKTIDFHEMVKEIKKNQLMAAIDSEESKDKPDIRRRFPLLEEHSNNKPMDIDNLVAKIDAKIAELEAEEEAERKKKEKESKYRVTITECNGDILLMAQIISDATGKRFGMGLSMLNSLPVDVPFRLKKEAEKFVRDINKAGGKASIMPKQNPSDNQE